MSVGMWATHNRSNILFALTVTSLSSMAAGDVPSSVAQCMVIKFFCNEGERAADIYHCLQFQFGENCLSCSSAFPWCQSFKDGHEPVSNMLHAWCHTTAVNQGPVCVDFLL
jgi:hypothetical protein